MRVELAQVLQINPADGTFIARIRLPASSTEWDDGFHWSEESSEWRRKPARRSTAATTAEAAVAAAQSATAESAAAHTVGMQAGALAAGLQDTELARRHADDEAAAAAAATAAAARVEAAAAANIQPASKGHREQAQAGPHDAPPQEEGTDTGTWQKFVDPSTGRPYYHDVESGTTQWTLPTGWRDSPILPTAGSVRSLLFYALCAGKRNRDAICSHATENANLDGFPGLGVEATREQLLRGLRDEKFRKMATLWEREGANGYRLTIVGYTAAGEGVADSWAEYLGDESQAASGDHAAAHIGQLRPNGEDTDDDDDEDDEDDEDDDVGLVDDAEDEDDAMSRAADESAVERMAGTASTAAVGSDGMVMGDGLEAGVGLVPQVAGELFPELAAEFGAGAVGGNKEAVGAVSRVLAASEGRPQPATCNRRLPHLSYPSPAASSSTKAPSYYTSHSYPSPLSTKASAEKPPKGLPQQKQHTGAKRKSGSAAASSAKAPRAQAAPAPSATSSAKAPRAQAAPNPSAEGRSGMQNGGCEGLEVTTTLNGSDILPAVGSIGRGSRVIARYLGASVWYPGHIVKVHADGTFDIAYDDGDHEAKVAPRYVKAARVGDATAPASKKQARVASAASARKASKNSAAKAADQDGSVAGGSAAGGKWAEGDDVEVAMVEEGLIGCRYTATILSIQPRKAQALVEYCELWSPESPSEGTTSKAEAVANAEAAMAKAAAAEAKAAQAAEAAKVAATAAADAAKNARVAEAAQMAAAAKATTEVDVEKSAEEAAAAATAEAKAVEVAEAAESAEAPTVAEAAAKDAATEQAEEEGAEEKVPLPEVDHSAGQPTEVAPAVRGGGETDERGEEHLGAAVEAEKVEVKEAMEAIAAAEAAEAAELAGAKVPTHAQEVAAPAVANRDMRLPGQHPCGTLGCTLISNHKGLCVIADVEGRAGRNKRAPGWLLEMQGAGPLRGSKGEMLCFVEEPIEGGGGQVGGRGRGGGGGGGQGGRGTHGVPPTTGRLRETVDLSRLRQPVPPAPAGWIDTLRAGDEAQVLHEGGWWHVMVLSRKPRGGRGGGRGRGSGGKGDRFDVQPIGYDVQRVVEASALRPHVS